MLKKILFFLLIPSLAFAGNYSGTATGPEIDRLHGLSQYNFKTDFGAVCDDTADDTAHLNSALSAIYTAGGGTLVIPGMCKISSGVITIPNNGDTVYPSQPPIRITGMTGSAANGFWVNGSAMTKDGLDLTYNAATAKILTLGAGRLEIDHLSIIDSGSDSAAFLMTTNTTLMFHDNYVSGTGSGASAVNDAIILGGVCTGCSTGLPGGNPQTGNTVNNMFQGYGTQIKNNFFDKMHRIAVFQAAANAITVTDNTISLTCGYPTGAVFDLLGGTTLNAEPYDAIVGDYIANNTLEVGSYKYVFNIGKAQFNSFFSNGVYDVTATTTAMFYFNVANQGAQGNLIIPGAYAATLPLTAGNAGIAATSTVFNSTGNAGSPGFSSGNPISVVGTTGNNYTELNVQSSSSGQSSALTALFGDQAYNYVRINTVANGIEGRGWLSLYNQNSGDAQGGGVRITTTDGSNTFHARFNLDNAGYGFLTAESGPLYLRASGAGVRVDGANLVVTGSATVATGGSTNHAVCWKSGGLLGYCSAVTDSNGVCGTCN